MMDYDESKKHSAPANDAVCGEMVSPPDGFCFSTEIGEIMGAIAASQSEFPIIQKSEEVDFTHNGRRTNYRYADLAKFVKAILPILGKNGVGVLQDCKTVPGGQSASTFVGHKESGQWIKSGAIVIKPSDGKAQTAGSASSYARRYSLTGFLSLCSEEDDDDAAVAGGVEPEREVPFGTPEHLALANQLMTKHEIHKDQRQEVIDWLVRTNQSPQQSNLDQTIYKTKMKMLLSQEEKKNVGGQ